MKLNRFLIAVPLTVSVLLTTSCNKNKENNTTHINTPEEDKTNLQSAGISLIQDMNDMKNLDAMHVVESFNYFAGQADPFGGNSTGYPLAIMNGLEAAAKVNSIKPIEQSLKTGNTNTLFSNYNDILGTYTWTNNTWVKTSSNNISFIFPSSKTSTTNDVTFTVTATEYTGTYLDASMEGNTPSSINAILTVGTKSVMSFDFSSKFNSAGEPTAIATSITMNPYKFSFAFDNSGTKISKTFKFDKNTTNIATFYVDATGTFSKTSIEDFINGEDASKLNSVVTNASGYLKVKDIKIAVTANITDAVNYYKGIGDANFTNNNAIDMLNNYSSIKLSYASSGQTIATGEWYLQTNTYTNYQWDNNTNNWVEVQETSEDPNIRAIFADGSKSDLETYFGNGFDDLENDLEQFFNDMDNAYDI